MEYDAVLIEQSIAKQYHILPSQQECLPYSDWAKMLSGLMDDTPLGRIVSIRSEQDQNILKNFTSGQRKIQQEWRSFIAGRKMHVIGPKETAAQMQTLEDSIARLFGGG